MATKVATVNFSIPIGEVPIVYTGKFLSVTLAKPAYAPGEKIRMIVMVEVTRAAQWIDILWGSIIIAYNAAGTKLTEVAVSHIAVPGVFDKETYDVDLDLGTQPSTGLTGRLELWCEGSPKVLVAVAEFGAPVVVDGVIPPEEPAPFSWLPIALIGGGALAAAAIISKKKKKA